MSKVILTSECEFCEYGTIDETDKSKIKVHCSYKNKTYFYGTCIPCDGMKKKKKDVLKNDK